MPLAPARYRNLRLNNAILHGIECSPAEVAGCCPPDLGPSGTASGTGSGTASGTGTGGGPSGGGPPGTTTMYCDGRTIVVPDTAWHVTLTGFPDPQLEFTETGPVGGFIGSAGYAYGTIFQAFPPDLGLPGTFCAGGGKPSCIYEVKMQPWNNGSYSFKRAGGGLILSTSTRVGPGNYDAPSLLCSDRIQRPLNADVRRASTVVIGQNLRTGGYTVMNQCNPDATGDPIAAMLAPAPLGYSPPAKAGLVNVFDFPGFGCGNSTDFEGGCFSACKAAVAAWLECYNRAFDVPPPPPIPPCPPQPPGDGRITGVAYKHRLYRQITISPMPMDCALAVAGLGYGAIFRTLITRRVCFKRLPNPPADPCGAYGVSSIQEIDKPYIMGLNSFGPVVSGVVPLSVVAGGLRGRLELGGGAAIEVST